MSRNVVAVIVVLSVITGIKGAEWLYDETVGSTILIDSQDWEDREVLNRKAIQKLEIGATLASVTDLMGTADFNEIVLKEDEKYQILYYRTQRTVEDGLTTKDECTPLIFNNRELVGWGNDYVSAISS